MLRNIGLSQILLLLLLFILVFGSKKIPDIAESIGKALKKFKKASQDAEEDTVTKEESEKIDKQDDELK
ncbi:MAG TPA: twin-arginine translocase TatA/TatE family subunit [Fibrobacter sp.]|nr:twin-arginine translocase TatA/TatE family subunit [Fibrobacter sp.]